MPPDIPQNRSGGLSRKCRPARCGTSQSPESSISTAMLP